MLHEDCEHRATQDLNRAVGYAAVFISKGGFMQVVSRLLGTFEIDPDTIITFPRPLPGIEHCQRYKLLRENTAQPVLYYMQALEDPEVTFSLVEPALLGVRYEIMLDDTEERLLELQDPNDLFIVLLLSRESSTSPIDARPHMPIIINTASRVGLQKQGLKCDIIYHS